MAQLKDTIITGDLSVTGTIYNNDIVKFLNKPMINLGENPTGGKSNDTWSFWTQKGTGYAFISLWDQVYGQPTQRGILLNYQFGNELYQLFHVQPNGDCYIRGANSATTAMTTWTQILTSAVGENAGYHNSIFRGKSLGTSVSTEQWATISAGTFNDLFIGDYWLINDIIWRIAAFDYWYDKGDTLCTTHHVVIVPDTWLVSTYGSPAHLMNKTSTTAGGYVGSDFYTGNNGNTAKSQCLTKINNAFGSAHILNHREYLTNGVYGEYSMSSAWYDSKLELMNEQMVWGTRIYGNFLHGANIAEFVTIDNLQLPLFALAPQFANVRADSWLRDVATSEAFSYLGWSGISSYLEASNMDLGIRPVFGIC